MKKINIKNSLDNINIDLDSIADENLRNAFHLHFNIIERLSTRLNEVIEENQKLKNEINLLKGEQQKPNIKPKNKGNKDISSESDRKNKDKSRSKGKNRDKRKKKIKITRREVCKIDKSILPKDAVYKGYTPITVQGLKIVLDNVEFLRETYYSPSLNKNFMADLPPGYENGYNPTVKSLEILLKYGCNTSEPKILEFLNYFDIQISGSTVSRALIKNKESFHNEKDKIYEAGLKSTIYQHIDDTGARVNGENYYTHIVCNDLYTAYFTLKHKDRLTIIDILRNFRDRQYRFDKETFSLLERLRVSKKKIKKLEIIEKNRNFSEKEMERLLQDHLPDIGKIHKTRILEAAAISSYHKEVGYPAVKVILSDDAPQFKLVTVEQALCWIHDGRHYKKLRPVIKYHKKLIKKFLKRYWSYYKELLKFKEIPLDGKVRKLSKKFDRLFSTKTGYEALDDRISKTKNKKKKLLMVLKYPEIPLHNNPAELGARQQVRKRDVSLQTRTEDGTKACDTFLTLIETLKKLGINVYEYIFDRVSKAFNIPMLSDIIEEKITAGEMQYCDSS